MSDKIARFIPASGKVRFCSINRTYSLEVENFAEGHDSGKKFTILPIGGGIR